MKALPIFILLLVLISCSPPKSTNPNPTPITNQASISITTNNYGKFSGSIDSVVIQNKPFILNLSGTLNNSNYTSTFSFAFALPLSSDNNTDQASFRFSTQDATIHNSNLYFPDYVFSKVDNNISITYQTTVKNVLYDVKITIPEKDNLTLANSTISQAQSH